MTIDQKLATLTAICMRQDTIHDSLNSTTSPTMIQHATKWLEDLEGAYDAINTIEVERGGSQ